MERNGLGGEFEQRFRAALASRQPGAVEGVAADLLEAIMPYADFPDWALDTILRVCDTDEARVSRDTCKVVTPLLGCVGELRAGQKERLVAAFEAQFGSHVDTMTWIIMAQFIGECGTREALQALQRLNVRERGWKRGPLPEGVRYVCECGDRELAADALTFLRRLAEDDDPQVQAEAHASLATLARHEAR